MQDLLNIAYIQPDIKWLDIDGNLRQYDEMLPQANGADITVLPEMFATGFTNDTETSAQDMNGSIVNWMKRKADEYNALIIGSQLITDNGKYYNRMLFAYPDGKLDWYDKHHLFRMGLEDETISPGTENKTIFFNGWRIRPIVCYDLRFPVWIRNTDYEYDLLLCIANWPTSRHNAFETLLKARAIENQCYAIGVNRIGKDGNGIEYAGGSSAIDIYGNVISQLPYDKAGIGKTTLSHAKLNTSRDNFPANLDADKFHIERQQY